MKITKLLKNVYKIALKELTCCYTKLKPFGPKFQDRKNCLYAIDFALELKNPDTLRNFKL